MSERMSDEQLAQYALDFDAEAFPVVGALIDELRASRKRERELERQREQIADISDQIIVDFANLSDSDAYRYAKKYAKEISKISGGDYGD